MNSSPLSVRRRRAWYRGLALGAAGVLALAVVIVSSLVLAMWIFLVLGMNNFGSNK